MRLRTALMLVSVVVEFFTYEAAWAASSTMKFIFFSRLAALIMTVGAGILLTESAVVWSSNGEEHLVLQREFRVEQERNREIHKDLREEAALSRKILYDLMMSQSRDEEFKKRIEEKFDVGMKILWSMCSLLIVQVVIPLLRVGLRRELAKAAKGSSP